MAKQAGFTPGEIIQLEKTSHQLIHPAIVRVVLHPGKRLSPEEVLAVRDLNIQLTTGRPYYILLITNEFSIPPVKSRKLFSQPDFNPLLQASAYVVNSKATRLAVNLFIQFNKPVKPIKIFGSEATALKWLNEQVNAKG